MSELSIELGIYVIALGVCGAEFGAYIIAAVMDTIGIEPSRQVCCLLCFFYFFLSFSLFVFV